MLNQAGSDSRATYASVSREELQRLKASTSFRSVPAHRIVTNRNSSEEPLRHRLTVSVPVRLMRCRWVYIDLPFRLPYWAVCNLYSRKLCSAVFSAIPPDDTQVYASADSMRRVAVAAGIPDAFVVALTAMVVVVSLSNARRSETGTSGSTVVRPQPAASTPPRNRQLKPEPSRSRYRLGHSVSRFLSRWSMHS